MILLLFGNGDSLFHAGLHGSMQGPIMLKLSWHAFAFRRKKLREILYYFLDWACNFLQRCSSAHIPDLLWLPFPCVACNACRVLGTLSARKNWPTDFTNMPSCSWQSHLHPSTTTVLGYMGNSNGLHVFVLLNSNKMAAYMHMQCSCLWALSLHLLQHCMELFQEM